MEYEINYLILQSNTAELIKLRQEMEDLIKSCDCKVLEKKEYLKRKLAYSINHENYGFHTVLRFKFIEGSVDIKNLKEKINLNLKVARYLIVRANGLLSLKELDNKTEIEKQEKSSEGKSVLKQEEVEKILAGKKNEIKKDTLKQDALAKDDGKESKSGEMNTNKKVKKSSVKKDIKSESEITKNKEDKIRVDGDGEKKTKKVEKEKMSLDDLDEKLDELLNI